MKNFPANLRNSTKISENYEIPDLSELWTDFKDIVKKNLENLGTHYYKLKKKN